MPLHYLDTSALLKRYVDEVGSEQMDALLASGPLATSVLVRVEVASALGRRTREGLLTEAESEDIYDDFLGELADFAVFAITPDVLDRAALLTRTSPSTAPLRALDAIHLATALFAFERHPAEDGSAGAFVTADRQLRCAAEHAGLRVIDPEQPDQG